MSGGGAQIGKSEGEKRLHRYCLKVAGEFGLQLQSASWVVDLVTKEHILTVVADTGTTEVRFEPKDIDDYARGARVRTLNGKIRRSLQSIND